MKEISLKLIEFLLEDYIWNAYEGEKLILIILWDKKWKIIHT